MTGLTRRKFLLTGAGAGVLSLAQLDVKWASAASVLTEAIPEVDYSGFESVYKAKWIWDKVVKGSHSNNCWYQRGCNWNVYVKEGIVWREEQAGTYEQMDPGIPDFNPRGCQKGACYSERMYDESRLRYPLKRVGERGEGKWKRVSWEEALNDIADKMIDAIISEDGSESIVMDVGTNPWGLETIKARMAAILDYPILDMNSEIGDHRPGVSLVMGKQEICSSADDLFHSDLIFIWGGNPVYTQIPIAHFINEARYNGAKVITVSPDFSASAVHADQLVNVKVGSDAALGLAMAQVIIQEKLYDERFIQEQSDMPLLVRMDNNRFLRESDLKIGGADDIFYFHDLASNRTEAASKKTLELGGKEPALEGVYTVQTLAGSTSVQPVFSLLRAHLEQYKPHKAVHMCGVDQDTIIGLARDLANAKAATFIAQSNFSKFYHGLEMERAQVLCAVLTGQLGRQGAGYGGFPGLTMDGIDNLMTLTSREGLEHALETREKAMAPLVEELTAKGLGPDEFMYEISRREYNKRNYVPTMTWIYFQAGLDRVYGRSAEWDRDMKRPLSEYMNEAMEKGWQVGIKTPTRVLIEDGGNLLRRLRSYGKVAENLLPQLDLLVTVDWKMSNTALHSDYVLPAAGWYEYDDFNWTTPLAPFASVMTAAVEPQGESKASFESQLLLAKAIQKRAKERGLEEFTDRSGQQRPFDVYNQLTLGGEYTEDNKEKSLDLALELSTNLGGIKWQELKEKGYERFTGVGQHSILNVGNATDVKPNKTVVAGTWHTEKKLPWPTLTGRLQFLIDQPFFEELGETLPVHKEPPNIGGNHPLVLTGGHTRWSIHSNNRDQKWMQQLRRGEPVVFINVDDAKERGIQDGDQVRVFNDIASTELQACVAAAIRPGQTTIYHAWEPYQFKGHQGFDDLFPNPLNPIMLAGGYGHVQARPMVFSPGGHDRATRVDVERVD